VAPDLARLEADHGALDDGLVLFDEALDATPRAGNQVQLGLALANLAFVFRNLGRAEIAATIYGSSTRYQSITNVPSLAELIEQLRDRLGDATFEHCVETGAAMDISDAVRHARQQIRTARDEPATTSAQAPPNHAAAPNGAPPSDTGSR
jgi:hypothetical protein